MRMSDLLGSTVKDLAGRRLGDVHDVRLVQNGPILGSWGAAFTADALLVGPHAVGVRLGYGRSEVRGPWAVRATFEAIHGVLDAIPWRSIVAIQPGTILVREDEPRGRRSARRSVARRGPRAARSADPGSRRTHGRQRRRFDAFMARGSGPAVRLGDPRRSRRARLAAWEDASDDGSARSTNVCRTSTSKAPPAWGSGS